MPHSEREPAAEHSAAVTDLQQLIDARNSANQTQQANLRSKLQTGDVIFYKTNRAQTFFDISPDQFDDFAVLAAFTQALAYIIQPDGNIWSTHPTDFKPWHHVALVTDIASDGTVHVVQFVQDSYSSRVGLNGRPAPSELDKLVEVPLEVPATQAISVLRGVGGWFSPSAAVTAIRQQAGRTPDGKDSTGIEPVVYSTNGLAAFALATKGRIEDPVSRETTLRLAYGAHVAVRRAEQPPNEESCTTSVAKAVNAGLMGQATPLQIEEPAAPDPARAAQLNAYANSPIAQMMASVLGRVERAGARSILDEIRSVGDIRRSAPTLAPFVAGLDDNETITADEVFSTVGFYEKGRLEGVRLNLTRSALGGGFGGEFPPNLPVPIVSPPPVVPLDPGHPYSPGPDTVTAVFVPKVAAAIEIALPSADNQSLSTLESDGANDMATPGHPSDDHLVVSPAMLWDAMVAAGFQEVQ